MLTRRELSALLDLTERDPNAERPFVGRLVSDSVRNARYPSAWQPLVERHVQLTGEDAATANIRLYCDLACTVITKKITMVDIFYLYERTSEPSATSTDDAADDESFREAHNRTASAYLAKMVACVYECVHGRPPLSGGAERAAALLYAETYAEAFEPDTVSERDVFYLVRKWFAENVLEGSATPWSGTIQNVAPGIPFLVCSHVYWLWLHLTAARVRHGVRELATVVYALDLIVYCDSCRTHFLEMRDEFFRDETKDGGHGNCYSLYTDISELLFRLHNKINARAGADVVESELVRDYKEFWRS